jgi:hypothetical protein
MLHELERIMHPSRALNTVVYDDQEGPLLHPAGPLSAPARAEESSSGGGAGASWREELDSKGRLPDCPFVVSSRGSSRS